VISIALDKPRAALGCFYLHEKESARSSNESSFRARFWASLSCTISTMSQHRFTIAAMRI